MRKFTASFLFGLMLLSSQAHAFTIDRINIGTVFGDVELYYPGEFNNFGLLGIAQDYVFSDGQTGVSGTGNFPYTNGTVVKEFLSGTDEINYEFGDFKTRETNGLIFYHAGSVGDYYKGMLDFWSIGGLAPASPVIIHAVRGSNTATLSGFAKVVFNDPPSNAPDDFFVHYSAPVGTVVPYFATYTLTDGKQWDFGIFNAPFEYRVSGYIAMVPEASSVGFALSGMLVMLLAGRIRKSA